MISCVDRSGYSIKKPETLEELKHTFKIGFISLFDECFNVAPYFLKYPDEQLFEIYADHLKTGFLLFAYDKSGELVGFAGSRPLLDDEYVADDVKSFFKDPADCYYHSELGTAKAHRGKGLAMMLIEETIKQTPVSKILMRTKENNAPSIEIHKKAGFKPIEVTQIIKRRNTLGEDVDDKRVYMLYDKKA
ncbi:MAG: GNAT family N-acetyltransferase [Clostridiales bacterium]|nr:GNAT family N-acetyltransferase [Clostridiales bacterium]